MITLRGLTIGERIESGRGRVAGRLALLGGVIYERRGSGEWRRVKDQARGRTKFNEADGRRRHGAWPSRK
ncbi:MAG TPA: hypothetical protein VGH33_27445, partial [Isosphaeraceae bacterium]